MAKASQHHNLQRASRDIVAELGKEYGRLWEICDVIEAVADKDETGRKKPALMRLLDLVGRRQDCIS